MQATANSEAKADEEIYAKMSCWCETNEKAKKGQEYTSAQQMREDRFKHKRMTGDVTGKYKLPMTSAQRNGFYN